MEQHSQTEFSGQMSFEEQEETFESVVEKMLEHLVTLATSAFYLAVEKKLEHHLAECETAEQAVKFIETQNFSNDFIEGFAAGSIIDFLYRKKGKKEEALKFAEMIEAPHEKVCLLVQLFEHMKH